MRRLSVLLLLLASSAFAEVMTPLRVAVIHVASSASLPVSCTVGTSPAVMTDDIGQYYSCSGGTYVWVPPPVPDYGLTNSDPILEYQHASSSGGGWRFYSGSTAPTQYFQATQSSTTGTATFTQGVAGGRWVFEAPGSSGDILSVTGTAAATGGFDSKTSGLFTSAVADASAAVAMKYKPATALTSGTDRYIHSFQDSAGNVGLTQKADGTWEFGGSGAVSGYINVAPTLTGVSYGINFIPAINTAGAPIGGAFTSTGMTGALFAPKDHASATHDVMIGGVFGPQAVIGRTHSKIIGGLFIIPLPGTGAATHTDEWGTWVLGPGTHSGTANRTITNMGGHYIPLLHTSAAGTNKPNVQNVYGLYVEEQKNAVTNNNGMFFANATSGYKAIAIRDQNAWIGSNAAATLTLTGTTAVTANGQPVMSGSNSAAFGVMMWGVMTATNAAYDTGTEVCAANVGGALACVTTFDVLGTGIACGTAHTLYDGWIAQCK